MGQSWSSLKKHVSCTSPAACDATKDSRSEVHSSQDNAEGNSTTALPGEYDCDVRKNADAVVSMLRAHKKRKQTGVKRNAGETDVQGSGGQTGVQQNVVATRHENVRAEPPKDGLNYAGDASPRPHQPHRRGRKPSQWKRKNAQRLAAKELAELKTDLPSPAEKVSAKPKIADQIILTENADGILEVENPNADSGASVPLRFKLYGNNDDMLDVEDPRPDSRISIFSCVQSLERPKRDLTRKPHYTDEIMVCANVDDLLDVEIPRADSRNSIFSCLQTMERPKRDLSRKPKYTDEIMVCENVDDILDAEIPNVGSSSSLDAKIKQILSDAPCKSKTEVSNANRPRKPGSKKKGVALKASSTDPLVVELSLGTAEQSRQEVLQRPRKKDSTRQPKFTDEVMLSENIDDILEVEIPTVKSSTSMDVVIKEILSDAPCGSKAKLCRSSVPTKPGPKKKDKPNSTEPLVLVEVNVDSLTAELVPGSGTVSESKSTATQTRQEVLQRPRKKDSTREPKFTDEVMLSESIDDILDIEVPDVKSSSSLDANIKDILSDVSCGGKAEESSVTVPTEPGQKKEDATPKEANVDSLIAEVFPASEAVKDTDVPDVQGVFSTIEIQSSGSGSSIKLRPMAATVFENSSPQQPCHEVDRRMGMANPPQKPAGPKPQGIRGLLRARRLRKSVSGTVYNSDELKLMAQIEAHHRRQ